MNSYLSINELIEELGNGLWTFCLRLTENRIEAEDLYQDTILKALELKDRLDYDNNPRAFIYSLAVSINKNRFRKFFRRMRIAPISEVELASLKDTSRSTEDELVQLEEKTRLDLAIEKLNKVQRPVILMYYMEDMSIREISDYLKIPEGTVKSRLNTARKNLRRELEDLDYEG